MSNPYTDYIQIKGIKNVDAGDHKMLENGMIPLGRIRDCLIELDRSKQLLVLYEEWYKEHCKSYHKGKEIPF